MKMKNLLLGMMVSIIALISQNMQAVKVWVSNTTDKPIHFSWESKIGLSKKTAKGEIKDIKVGKIKSDDDLIGVDVHKFTINDKQSDNYEHGLAGKGKSGLHWYFEISSSKKPDALYHYKIYKLDYDQWKTSQADRGLDAVGDVVAVVANAGNAASGKFYMPEAETPEFSG